VQIRVSEASRKRLNVEAARRGVDQQSLNDEVVDFYFKNKSKLGV